ncbi:hypothetical protein [Singulisphaera sp. PoT]|uniref:hypothetical protein n=1 Tax=Singulisphaera sp. PoT TaxID=3411797 RepID=UPI003BF50A20
MRDGVILIGALAAGMGLAKNATNGHFNALWLIDMLLASGILAGPFVLVGQWWSGRRTALSHGERLWATSSSLILPLLVWGYLDMGLGILNVFLAIAALIHFLISLYAAIYLAVSVLGPSVDVPCRWTDRLGCLVCSVVFPGVVLSICIELNQTYGL